MSEENNKSGNFIEDWLNKMKQKRPDSAIIEAIRTATVHGQLDESKLLKLLREKAKSNEKHNTL